jgi:FixJ family two-component response regulator
VSVAKKVIAVIEDNPEMRTATARILSAYGYATETFDSASAFLNATATSRATCLVVDIQLGEISGVELARQLKAEGFECPIIFMTGLDDERIRRQAAAVGAVAYLNNPFPAQLLIEAIIKSMG